MERLRQQFGSGGEFLMLCSTLPLDVVNNVNQAYFLSTEFFRVLELFYVNQPFNLKF